MATDMPQHPGEPTGGRDGRGLGSHPGLPHLKGQLLLRPHPQSSCHPGGDATQLDQTF